MKIVNNYLARASACAYWCDMPNTNTAAKTNYVETSIEL